MTRFENSLVHCLSECADIPCPQCTYNLRQNLSGRCPECGSQLALQVVAVGGRRSITGVLAYMRVGLILIPLALSWFAFAHQLSTVLSGSNNGQVGNMLLVTFGAGTGLGAVTFGSLFVVRQIHFVTSILFFGLVAFIMTVNIVSEILAGITYASPAATYASMSGFLLMGIAGLTIEVICDRKLRRPGHRPGTK